MNDEKPVARPEALQESLIKTLWRSLGTLSPLSVFLIGLFVAVWLGFIDYLTGDELGFDAFYVFPIALVTWQAGILYGIALSLFCALVWIGIDVLTSPAGTLTYFLLFWNVSLRFLTFMLITYLLWQILIAKKRQEEITGFLVHDLRAPLSIIEGALTVLNESAFSKLERREQDFLSTALASCRRMVALVSSILDTTRLQEGKMPLELSPVVLKEAVDFSVHQISVVAKRNSVDLEVRYDEDPGMITSDRGLLVRIFINLLNNAIKISPPGSTVSIEVRREDKTGVLCRVSDRGRGIPPQLLPKIFDRFVQIKAQDRGVNVGSGLGLNFCKLAVELLGGRIWVESALGKGTQVNFTLPLKNPDSEGGRIVSRR